MKNLAQSRYVKSRTVTNFFGLLAVKTLGEFDMKQALPRPGFSASEGRRMTSAARNEECSNGLSNTSPFILILRIIKLTGSSPFFAVLTQERKQLYVPVTRKVSITGDTSALLLKCPAGAAFSPFFALFLAFYADCMFCLFFRSVLGGRHEIVTA